MAKKIKFPLEMKDGVKVRSLDELRENFDLERLIIYFIDGRLVTWLMDRYYEQEREKISQLSIDDSEFKTKLCGIFEMNYLEKDKLDIEILMLHNKRLNKLKQYTDDEKILKSIDKVAFNQEELIELLDNNENLIYICNNEFTIPLTKTNVKYIGISNPIINLDSDEDFCLENLNIKIEESSIKCIGRGENKKREETKFKLILSDYEYDLVKSNIDMGHEEIIDEHVIDFCKYKNMIFYITCNGEIKKFNINNINDRKTIYELPYDCLGYSRDSWCLISDNCVGERIFSTDDFLIIKIHKGNIFKIKHNGEGFENIVNTPYHIFETFLLENNLYYLVGSDDGIYKINLDGNEAVRLDSARRMEIYNDKIYYEKYLRYSGDYTECICSCDLDGKNKKVIKNILGFIRDFKCINNKITYTTGKITNQILIEE